MSEQSNSEPIKAVSLFSGVGGIDIGLHKAGVKTVACVEKDERAAKSLKINSSQHDDQPEEDLIAAKKRFPWHVIQDDIRNIKASDILDTADANKKEIELVVGGPPCQTFSRSNEGDRKGTNTDRGRLYEEFARILHALEPSAFIFENVRGLKSANGGSDLETIRNELKRNRYFVNSGVVNAANYGVPQTRKRLLILGREEVVPEFPKPSYSENGNGSKQTWIDAGDALDGFDLDESIMNKGGWENAIGSKYGPLLKRIPEGANYQHFSERKYDSDREEYVERTGTELEAKRFDWRSRHWNYLLKLDQDRPSWTLQAAPGTTVGPFHWRARKISLLEQMKLMSIPLNYYIAGSPNQIQEQIGNAVPPKLAESLANSFFTDRSMKHIVRSSDQTTESEKNENRKSKFRVEVSNNKSPWHYANRILKAVRSDEAVTLETVKGAVPNALDALSISQWQSKQNLDVEITEQVRHPDGEKHPISVLQGQVITEKTKIKMSD